MLISDVLRRKGGTVVTVAPTASVPELLGLLAEHRVGALVVAGQDEAVAGIVSERDVVRRLHADGAALLDLTVADLMTRAVHTASPADTVDALARTMTEQRVRHVPVLDAGVLVGIISIGDVVKHRIDELTHERDQLDAYIHS